MQINSLSPLLKWAGGKRSIVDQIAALYAPHRDCRLVEPFCGGLAIALGLQPETALLNDINTHLINFYRIVQDCDFEFSGENVEAYYYAARDRLNSTKSGSYQEIPDIDYEKAQDFYYLNLAGFNGLCRYNQKGEFNVPFGKRNKLSVCDDFTPYQKAFSRWYFSNDDYKDLNIKDNDFLFVDPPYDCDFTSYSGNDFGWKEQIELADWLDRCPSIPQIACNAATDRIVELYTDRGWNIEIVEMRRSISCNGDRSKAKEMFATKNMR